MIQPDIIYKICPEEEWTAAQTAGIYTGSPDDERDGFIHFSSADQIEGTLNKHFADQRGLLLLSVAVERLDQNALKWEISRNGEKFPHLYSALEINTVVEVKRIPDGETV